MSREGCSLVGLGLYLTRSALRIQNSKFPVGCMSTCGFVRWTSKVTLFRRSVSSFRTHTTYPQGW